MTVDTLSIPFALAEFKNMLEKAKKSRLFASSHPRHPVSIGAKLLTASNALHACRTRHLGTLLRCCEGWESVGKCFDPISFERIDFQRLSQIIANLTPESLAEREAEIRNLPWTQTEKDNAELDNVPGVPKNPCFVSMPSLMKSIGDPFFKPA